ncbi:MAG: type II toxin-antitoxin system death-on-curing family toxin [Candidatus Hydrogenedentes bacterium]|nr:type II toxin-antitoxin system death-on-curing family toxin [Candidatus Hydrogenedentota bacterium]
MPPVFLSTDDVLEIHEDQIRRYGGMAGVRDLSLLQSAAAQPCAKFNQAYLHRDAFEMAAAYLIHIVRNHTFVDGNKRTGAGAAAARLSQVQIGFTATAVLQSRTAHSHASLALVGSGGTLSAPQPSRSNELVDWLLGRTG